MSHQQYISVHGANEGKDDSGLKPPQQPVSVLAPPGLVSIIIPCCGMLEYTKVCLPSILRHSRDPYELIFLDIGSLDGTAEYLAGLSAAAKLRIEVVRAATDLDIPAACKEAIRQARGEYLLLLNNDTVVTDAWLGQMVAPALHRPSEWSARCRTTPLRRSLSSRFPTASARDASRQQRATSAAWTR